MADEERIDGLTFKEWREQVSALCEAKFGLSLDDLPDLITWDYWRDGVPPEEFFEEDVMEMMRAEFGSVIDKL